MAEPPPSPFDLDDGDRAMTSPVERLDPAAPLSAIGLSFPEAVVEGDPQEAATVFHEMVAGAATAGLWESEAGIVRFDPYPIDELCIVVAGRVTLRADGGGEETFGPSDLFIVRQSFRGLWIMPEAFRKFYVELRASA